MVNSIKNNLFNQHMVGFLNKLELSDQNFKINGTVRDENYGTSIVGGFHKI